MYGTYVLRTPYIHTHISLYVDSHKAPSLANLEDFETPRSHLQGRPCLKAWRQVAGTTSLCIDRLSI